MALLKTIPLIVTHITLVWYVYLCVLCVCLHVVFHIGASCYKQGPFIHNNATYWQLTLALVVIYTITYRLSARSVLLPTSMIMTSGPRSARTSSIHFDVCWNELASTTQCNTTNILIKTYVSGCVFLIHLSVFLFLLFYFFLIFIFFIVLCVQFDNNN